MCFGDETEENGRPVPGTERCAREACGSGHRWCNESTKDSSFTGTHWRAPWQQLARSGTSDGTFRNNFWSTTCWVDPFLPGDTLNKEESYSAQVMGSQLLLSKPANTFSAGTSLPRLLPSFLAPLTTAPSLQERFPRGRAWNTTRIRRITGFRKFRGKRTPARGTDRRLRFVIHDYIFLTGSIEIWEIFRDPA